MSWCACQEAGRRVDVGAFGSCLTARAFNGLTGGPCADLAYIVLKHASPQRRSPRTAAPLTRKHPSGALADLLVLCTTAYVNDMPDARLTPKHRFSNLFLLLRSPDWQPSELPTASQDDSSGPARTRGRRFERMRTSRDIHCTTSQTSLAAWPNAHQHTAIAVLSRNTTLPLP